MYKALIDDIAELQRGYARRREAAEAAKRAAKPPAPLAKARPPVRPAPRPAARRLAPPVAKPAPRRAAAPAKAVPADWLDRIKADQQAAEATIFKQRLRDASAQVARGEVSAIDAAKLDAINHRASALGLWR